MRLNRQATGDARYNEAIFSNGLLMTYHRHECEAIALEITKAFREAWASKDERFRDACTVVYKLLRGTEEDLEPAQELLPKFKPDLNLSEVVPRFMPRVY